VSICVTVGINAFAAAIAPRMSVQDSSLMNISTCVALLTLMELQ